MSYILTALVAFLVIESVRQGRPQLIKWWIPLALALVWVEFKELGAVGAFGFSCMLLLVFAGAYRYVQRPKISHV